MFPFCPWGFFRKVANYGFELSYVFLLAFFLKTEFPTYFEKGIINVSYNIIFYYSKAELVFLKCKKQIVKYTKELLDSSVVFFLFKNIKSSIQNCKNYFFKSVVNEIQFIKDNNVVFETTKDIFSDTVSELNLVLRKKPNYDFILFSDYSAKSEDGTVPKLIFYSLPSKERLNYELACSKSIMSCRMSFPGDKHDIYILLKSQNYNYFVVDNVFNNVFFEYFLKTHYLKLIQYSKIKELTKDDFNQYTIEIFDKDVNIITVKNSDKIKIQKDNITIEP
jgi:hypothetical protein